MLSFLKLNSYLKWVLFVLKLLKLNFYHWYKTSVLKIIQFKSFYYGGAARWFVS